MRFLLFLICAKILPTLADLIISLSWNHVTAIILLFLWFYRRVVIILEIEVVMSAEDVGGRIGDPIPFTEGKAKHLLYRYLLLMAEFKEKPSIISLTGVGKGTQPPANPEPRPPLQQQNQNYNEGTNALTPTSRKKYTQCKQTFKNDKLKNNNKHMNVH